MRASTLGEVPNTYASPTLLFRPCHSFAAFIDTHRPSEIGRTL